MICIKYDKRVLYEYKGDVYDVLRIINDALSE